MEGLCVIIPAFNPLPEELRSAVESALACAEVHRVIVVDDGSREAVELDRHAGESRVELVRQANAGPSSARNRGLDVAARLDPDGVLFLDHDDRLIPSGVASLLSLARATGAVAGVAARIEVSPNSVRTPKRVPGEWAGRMLPSPDLVFVPKQLFAAPGTLVMRPAAGIRFDESLIVVEDRDYLRRVGDLGPIAVSAEPVVEYRVGVAGTLSSPAHVSRRIRGHLKILDRHWSAAADAPLREATIWLINFAAKTAGSASRRPHPDGVEAGIDPSLWRELLAAAKARGWRIPFKARCRWWLAGNG